MDFFIHLLFIILRGPATAATPGIIQKIHDYGGGQLPIYCVEYGGISQEAVHAIITDDLAIKKVSVD